MSDYENAPSYSPESFAEAGGYRHPDSIINIPCVIVNLEKIRIERKVQIDAFCYILGGRGVELGSRTHLASGVTISGGGSLRTGWCTGLAAGVRVITGTDEPLSRLAGPCVPEEFRQVHRGEVVLEDFSVIFTNATVFPDVHIGKGALIGAGTVVRNSVEPWGIYAGNPLRKIGTRDRAGVEAAAKEMVLRYGF